jgi:hypothetical protein
MNILSSRQMSVLACLTVFLVMIIRVIFFYNAPDSVLIGVVPDDAFYYMQMAKHRAFEGLWTFDGTSSATGFHFLYAYFLFFFYSIFGVIDWRQLFLIIGVLSSAFIALSAYFVARTAGILFGRKSVLLAVAPFFSSAALMQSTSMMESWLVLFFSAATIYFLAKDENPSVFGIVALTFLGVLGSLSRTDYGMLPGVIFFAFLVSNPSLNNYRLKRSIFVLAGGIIGVVIVLMQNLQISGQIFQASAQTKLYWSSVIGHNVSIPINLALSILIPFYSSLNHSFQSLVLFCTACLFAYSWRKFARERDRIICLPTIVFGCLLTILGYILFYRYNSQSLQIWYASNFIAPIGISSAALGFFVFREKLFIPALIVFFTFTYSCIRDLYFIPYPHQAGMMQAGLFLKGQKSGDIYASWNAGIISYFSGTNLINLDGLTNDEVLPFIKSNSLFDYIQSRKINYLIDYDEELNSRTLRVRGGYFDERIDRCIHPLQAVDGDSMSWGIGRLRVFEVIHGCN